MTIFFRATQISLLNADTLFYPYKYFSIITWKYQIFYLMLIFSTVFSWLYYSFSLSNNIPLYNVTIEQECRIYRGREFQSN